MKDLDEIRRRMREAKTLDEMLTWWIKGIEVLRNEENANTAEAAAFLRNKHPVGSEVVCQPDWTFGVQNGYDKNPGTVTARENDVLQVEWQDGHVSIHSDDELISKRTMQ